MRNWNRALLGLALSGVLAFGAAMFAFSREHKAAAASEFTIEISAQGFNPQTCVVNRGVVVQFHNIDSKPHTVIEPQLYDPNPDSPTPNWSSGPIAPGETGGRLAVEGNYNATLQDLDNPDFKVHILSPNNDVVDECAPQTPTPTPTNTPKATATPTPTQFSPRCYGSQGCAVAPGVSRDEPQP